MRRIFGTEVVDYLPAFVLLVLTAGYLVTAYQYAPESRIMPALVAWCMLALLGVDLMARTQTPVGARVSRWLNPSNARGPQSHRPEHTIARQIDAVLWLTCLIVMLVLIGVLYAVPLYLFAAIRLRGRRPLLTSSATAAGVTLAMWLLFTGLLHLELYKGLLFGGS